MVRVIKKLMDKKVFRFYLYNLSRLEIWIVTGLVVLCSVIPSIGVLGIVLIGGYWLIRKIVHNRFSKRTPIDWAILLLVVMVCITGVLTFAPGETSIQAIRLLSGVGLFYAIINHVTKQKAFEQFLIVSVIIGFLLSIYALIGIGLTSIKLKFLPIELLQLINQLFEPVNPNVIAGYIAVLLPVVASYMIFIAGSSGRFRKSITVLSIIFMMGLLIFTNSRGAWLAIIIASLILVGMTWRWGWIGLPFSLIVFGFIYSHLSNSGIVNGLTQNGTLGGLAGRLEVWSRAINVSKVFVYPGISPGTFNDIVDNLYPFLQFDPGRVPHAHNLYMQVMVDLGLPGLIVWLSILGSVAFASWKVFRWGRDGNSLFFTRIGAGLVSSQVALMIHGTIDAVTWTVARPYPLVWAMWGFVIAAFIQSKTIKFNG